MMLGLRLLDDMERDSHRIVGMICSETVPETDIEAAVAALRSRTLAEFPARPKLFDETYGRRFARLRTRFRAGAGLFGATGSTDAEPRASI